MKPNLPEGAFDAGRDAVEKALRVAYGIDGIEMSESMVELAGGASARRFFRVPTPGGTTLAMQMPAPSAELSRAKQANQAQSFLEVQRLLRSVNVPVPAIHFDAPHPEVILLEDLGDATLAVHLGESPRDREELYRLAVEILGNAQHALGELPPDSSVTARSFDRDLLDFEVEHFREWALEARGIKLDSSQNAIFDAAKEYLTSSIASLPYGFVHRDYQSKNLMVRRDERGKLTLTWIDFQDAMLGPRVYDLVALLMDSYQDLAPEFVRARLEDYSRVNPHEGGFERLLYEFDLVTVQRKLKDAGRFIFLDRKMGNSGFLPFVDGSIRRARAALGRIRSSALELEKLEKLLDSLALP